MASFISIAGFFVIAVTLVTSHPSFNEDVLRFLNEH